MEIIWKKRAALNQARASLGATISNGRVYACGGVSGIQSGPDQNTLSAPVGIMEEFTPLSNKWVLKKSMPTKRDDLAMASAIDGKIYAIGGFNQKPHNVVEEYDPMLDTWQKKSPMPTSRFLFLAAMGAKDGKIYAIGGWGTEAQGWVLDKAECYDPLKDSWKSLKPMPTPRGELAVAAASNGRIYAIGGVVKAGTPLSTVEEYDPRTDEWSTRTPLPTSRYCLAAVGASNDMIYAIGGIQQCTPINVVEEYDPKKDSWAKKAAMPTARWFLGAAASYVPHDQIFAIGGAYKEKGGKNLKVLATVEEGGLEYVKWRRRTPEHSAEYSFTKKGAADS